MAATAGLVVAELIPPWLASPPRSNSALAFNAHSKPTEKSALLAPVENKPEIASRRVDGSVSYWLENIKHQGISAFHPDKNSYQVFRNVKDFGARGTCHPIGTFANIAQVMVLLMTPMPSTMPSVLVGDVRQEPANLLQRLRP